MTTVSIAPATLRSLANYVLEYIEVERDNGYYIGQRAVKLRRLELAAQTVRKETSDSKKPKPKRRTMKTALRLTVLTCLWLCAVVGFTQDYREPVNVNRNGNQNENRNGNQNANRNQNQNANRNQNQNANRNQNESRADSSTNISEARQTPTAIAPDAFPSAPCRVAAGVGGSSYAFGVSFGGSKLDKDCDAREAARFFALIGMPDAARQILCSLRAAKVVKDCLTMEFATVEPPPAPPAPAAPPQIIVPPPSITISPVIQMPPLPTPPAVVPAPPVPPLGRRPIHHKARPCQCFPSK